MMMTTVTATYDDICVKKLTMMATYREKFLQWLTSFRYIWFLNISIGIEDFEKSYLEDEAMQL